ncbi:ROK family protein, partial [Streptomyces nigra]
MTAPLHEVNPAGAGRALPDTQQGMRRRNLARVMHTVSAEGPLSRAAVASRIGLTRAAVSTLVAEQPGQPRTPRSAIDTAASVIAA